MHTKQTRGREREREREREMKITMMKKMVKKMLALVRKGSVHHDTMLLNNYSSSIATINKLYKP
jgi:ribosomal protein S20